MLIGLTGRAGAGKDMAYKRIEALLPNHDVRRFSFAAPLKESVAALFDMEVWEVEACKNSPIPFAKTQAGEFTMREILQRYGTEAHRGVFGDNFWVDQAMGPALDWYNAAMGHGPRHAVFTDVRFPNEAQAIINASGRVYEVVGPEGRQDPNAPHASERGLADGYLEDLIHNMVRDDDCWALDTALIPVLIQGPKHRSEETLHRLVTELRTPGN